MNLFDLICRAPKAEDISPRFVVYIGTDEQLIKPAPGWEHLQAAELGRYPDRKSAEKAQRDYNRQHEGEDIYAWMPIPLD